MAKYKSEVTQVQESDIFLRIFKKILSKYASTLGEARVIMRNQDYSFFRLVAYNGHQQIMQYVASIMPRGEIARMVTSAQSSLLIGICENGDLAGLMHLLSLVPQEDRVQVLRSTGDFAFKHAACFGHVKILRHIVSMIPPEKLAHMWRCVQDESFSAAAEHGHLTVMQYLVNNSSDVTSLNKMIHARGNFAFRCATGQGQIAAMNLFLELTPNIADQYYMIHSRRNGGLYDAINNSKMEAIKYIFLFDMTYIGPKHSDAIFEENIKHINGMIMEDSCKASVLKSLIEAKASMLEEASVYHYGIENGYKFHEINSDFEIIKAEMKSTPERLLSGTVSFSALLPPQFFKEAAADNFVNREAYRRAPSTSDFPPPAELHREDSDYHYVHQLLAPGGASPSSLER